MNVGCVKWDCCADVVRCECFYDFVGSYTIGNITAILVHLVSRNSMIPEDVVEGVNTTHGAILVLKVDLLKLDREGVGKGWRWC